MALLWQLFVAGPAVRAVVRTMGAATDRLRQRAMAGRAAQDQS